MRRASSKRAVAQLLEGRQLLTGVIGAPHFTWGEAGGALQMDGTDIHADGTAYIQHQDYIEAVNSAGQILWQTRFDGQELGGVSAAGGSVWTMDVQRLASGLLNITPLRADPGHVSLAGQPLLTNVPYDLGTSGILARPDGGVVVYGIGSGSTQVAGGIGSLVGAFAVWVDAQGSFQHVATFGDSHFALKAATVAPDGSVYFAGDETIDIAEDETITNAQAWQTRADIFRYSSDATEVWERSYSAGGVAAIESLSADSAGDLHVAIASLPVELQVITYSPDGSLQPLVLRPFTSVTAISVAVGSVSDANGGLAVQVNATDLTSGKITSLVKVYDTEGDLLWQFGSPNSGEFPGHAYLQNDSSLIFARSGTTLDVGHAGALYRLGNPVVNGTFIITGSDAADDIMVTQANGMITATWADGSSTSAPAAGITSIHASLLGGNDRFSSSVNLPTYVSGGTGNDTITTGDGNDTISGGAGNDVISAGGGDDYVLAGAGGDFVRGGAGNDTIYGLGGNDTLLGNAGDDALYGNTGDDWLRSGVGNHEFVSGGAGNDLVCTPAANLRPSGSSVSIHAGGGNDTIVAGSYLDQVWGGAGADVLDAPAGVALGAHFQDGDSGDVTRTTAPVIAAPTRYGGVEFPAFQIVGGIPATLVQPDGKILVAVDGRMQGDDVDVVEPHIIVMRLNADLSLDTSFGANGFASIDALRGGQALALQPDGSILVGGSYDSHTPNLYAGENAGIARLTPDGNLDTSFGQGGICYLPDQDRGHEGVGSLWVLANGDILAACPTQLRDESPGNKVDGPPYTIDSGDIYVTRVTSAGVVDTSFNGGRTIIDNQTGSQVGGDALQQFQMLPDGSSYMLVGVAHGQIGVLAPTWTTQLVRLDTNGLLDNAFRDRVAQVLPAGATIEAFVALPDGSVSIITEGTADQALLWHISMNDSSSTPLPGVTSNVATDSGLNPYSMWLDSSGRVMVGIAPYGSAAKLESLTPAGEVQQAYSYQRGSLPEADSAGTQWGPSGEMVLAFRTMFDWGRNYTVWVKRYSPIAS